MTTPTPAPTVRVRIDRLRQYEAEGQRPPGYADAMLARAAKVGKRWAVFDAATYRSIAEQYESIDALKYLEAEPAPSRGLGDTIARITKAVGVKPCGGCKKRQAALNRLVPYKD